MNTTVQQMAVVTRAIHIYTQACEVATDTCLNLMRLGTAVPTADAMLRAQWASALEDLHVWVAAMHEKETNQ